MKHYEKLIELGCFTRSQLAQLLGNDASAGSMIQEYVRKGLIERIRRDLYAVISLETKQPIPSRYQIGSKLFPDACISHHSAFEVFGYANQVFYETYVSTNSRFSDFTYHDVLYHRIAFKQDTAVTHYSGVRVTTLEQTVVDSIRDFEKIGGLEETLRCLLLIPSLNESKLLDVLKHQGNGFLYQKCGYILQEQAGTLGLSETFFNECQKHITHSKRYLFNDKTEQSWNAKWNLYVPPSLQRLTDKGVVDHAI